MMDRRCMSTSVLMLAGLVIGGALGSDCLAGASTCSLRAMAGEGNAHEVSALLQNKIVLDAANDEGKLEAVEQQNQKDTTSSLQDPCPSLVNGCRQALKHLRKMMFKPNPDDQQCNNFARKSVQGFFHDFLSSWIDGSILHELHTDDNKGLCKWAQYINALSDTTRCDPGSIIAMAGILGSEACGEPMMKDGPGGFKGAWCQWAWDQGGVKPKFCKGPLNGGIVTILRGYPCSQRMSDRFFSNGEIKHDFTGLMLSSDPAKMDDFVERQTLNITAHKGGFQFASLNTSAAMLERYWHFAFMQASIQAHNFGRVTCPVSGMVKNKHVSITPGFWNPLFKTAKGYLGDPYGMLGMGGQYDESKAYRKKMQKAKVPSNYKSGMIYAKIKGREKLRETQCDWGKPTMDPDTDYCPTFTPSSSCWVRGNGPVRMTNLTSKWAKYDRQPGETDFNIEAGCCNMPGQPARAPVHHKNKVDIGTTATVSKWDGGGRFGLFMTMHFFQNDGEHEMKPGFSTYQTAHKYHQCTRDLNISAEMPNLGSVTLPQTDALDYFYSIAWDGVDSINSAWDNCVKDNCKDMNMMENKLCGGGGLTWRRPV